MDSQQVSDLHEIHLLKARYLARLRLNRVNPPSSEGVDVIGAVTMQHARRR